MGHALRQSTSEMLMVTPRFKEGDLCMVGFGSPGLFGINSGEVVLCEIKGVHGIDERYRCAVYEVDVVFDETERQPMRLLVKDSDAVYVDDDLIETMIAAVDSKATQLRKILKQLHRYSTGRMKPAAPANDRVSEA